MNEEHGVNGSCMRFRVVVLAITLGAMAAEAQQVTKTGTTAAKFLSIPVGARAVAMGGAYVGTASDATAMFWNPAGLADIVRQEVSVSHMEWLAGMDFTYGGAVLPVGSFGTLGFNLTSLNVGEMERTTEEFPDGTGQTFGAGSVAIGVSVARQLTDAFAIGANIKYVHEYIWNSRAGALAVDLGTLFRTPLPGLSFGAAISNFGQKMQMSGDDLLVQKDISPSFGNNANINAALSTDRFDLPLTLRLGMTYVIDVLPGQRLTLGADASHPNDNAESVSLGAEYTLFDDLLAVRGGYRSLGLSDREERLSLGGGVRVDATATMTVRVDYAYQEFARFSSVHLFSLGMQF